jgi:hypothetical protein
VVSKAKSQKVKGMLAVARRVISLELFDSRPLNLHLLYLVCVVNIIFCVVLCFILFSGLN